jgi:hypothetical protein
VYDCMTVCERDRDRVYQRVALSLCMTYDCVCERDWDRVYQRVALSLCMTV